MSGGLDEHPLGESVMFEATAVLLAARERLLTLADEAFLTDHRLGLALETAACRVQELLTVDL